MTRMLVVVRSAEDAVTAVEGGADGLVVRGTPDSLDGASAHRAIVAVARRVPVALWLPRQDSVDSLHSSESGAIFVDLRDCHSLEGDASATAVLPFDPDGFEASVATVAARGFHGMVFGEGGQPRRLLQVVTIRALDAFIRKARARRLAVGFAGTMEMPDIPRLVALAPDMLVFDDLVREPGRIEGPISPERIALVRALIPTHSEPAASIVPAAIGLDRIFVRDWTVSIPVGAYSHESAPQRARFTVEVALASASGPVADLRGVMSYDLITDAISRATAGHVDLVETIAEDVAAAILVHPRAVSVDIMVEKLDLGPGSLGCRIVRGRPA